MTPAQIRKFCEDREQIEDAIEDIADAAIAVSGNVGAGTSTHLEGYSLLPNGTTILATIRESWQGNYEDHRIDIPINEIAEWLSEKPAQHDKEA